MALGTAECEHGIGRGPDLRFAFLGIPEKIAGDKDIAVMAKERFQPFLDGDDPLELECVLRHGLPVACGVFDLRGPRRRDQDTHDR